MPEGISIIICCFNSSSRITPTLEALQRQTFAGKKILWEVILVDNASIDDTAAVAKRIWSNKPVAELRVLLEEKPGLMNARKKGLASAVYDIVSFIDDDNWVEEHWVEKVSDIFLSNSAIGACGGISEAVFEKLKPEWFDEYQNSFAVGECAQESGVIDNEKGFLWGAGLSIRKKIWDELQLRGFKNLTLGREGKNITAGEDTELCFAIRLLGYQLYYCNSLLLKHFMPDNRMNLEYLAKMYYGFGKAYARLNCYRVLLYPNKFKLYPWWYEWIVAQKNVIRFLLIEMIAASRSEKIKAITQRAYNRGYALQVWQDKRVINKNIAELIQIFKR